MKSTTSILAAVATVVTSVSAAATPKLYKIYVMQPTSSEILSIAWFHSGAASVESDLENIKQFPSIDYYFSDNRLFSPVYSASYPDMGYSFNDVGDTPGAIAVAGGQFGMYGRADWVIGTNGSLTVPSQGPSSSFFQCKMPAASGGGIANVLAYGNPFTNGSLPQGCTSTVKLFVKPA